MVGISFPFRPPSAKTTSGYSDSFKFAICGYLYYRGWEKKASSTHFLLPALLERVRISFLKSLTLKSLLLSTAAVAKVWPLSVRHLRSSRVTQLLPSFPKPGLQTRV